MEEKQNRRQKETKYQKTGAERKWMRPELLCQEIRKLCSQRMLHLFLLLCIGFNLLLVTGSMYGDDYIAYVRQVRDTVGARMGPEFARQVAELPDCTQKERLLRETQGAVDLLEGYDADQTARQMLGNYRIKGWAADALVQKYHKQQNRILALARQDASMDVGAAGMTTVLFDMLFVKLCRAILTEGIFFAVLTALYLCRMEHMERTWQTVYTTWHGRKIQREKCFAGLLYAAAAYGILAAVSCLAFAGVWQLGGIWDTNMATQFYEISYMGMRLPFVPWADLTMRSYLAAVLVLGLDVTAVFYMLGYLAGLLTKNSLAAFLLLLVLAALRFEIVMLAGNAGNWGIYEAALWSPVMFWWSQPLWFSDMGIHAVVPWQECAVGGCSLLLAGLLLVMGYRYFDRKDLV